MLNMYCHVCCKEDFQFLYWQICSTTSSFQSHEPDGYIIMPLTVMDGFKKKKPISKQTTLQLYMLEHIDSHREIYMLKSKTKPVNLTYI